MMQRQTLDSPTLTPQQMATKLNELLTEKFNQESRYKDLYKQLEVEQQLNNKLITDLEQRNALILGLLGEIDNQKKVNLQLHLQSNNEQDSHNKIISLNHQLVEKLLEQNQKIEEQDQKLREQEQELQKHNLTIAQLLESKRKHSQEQESRNQKRSKQLLKGIDLPTGNGNPLLTFSNIAPQFFSTENGAKKPKKKSKTAPHQGLNNP
jgi:hypothetical protein